MCGVSADLFWKRHLAYALASTFPDLDFFKVETDKKLVPKFVDGCSRVCQCDGARTLTHTLSARTVNLALSSCIRQWGYQEKGQTLWRVSPKRVCGRTARVDMRMGVRLAHWWSGYFAVSPEDTNCFLQHWSLSDRLSSDPLLRAPRKTISVGRAVNAAALFSKFWKWQLSLHRSMLFRQLNAQHPQQEFLPRWNTLLPIQCMLVIMFVCKSQKVALHQIPAHVVHASAHALGLLKRGSIDKYHCVEHWVGLFPCQHVWPLSCLAVPVPICSCTIGVRAVEQSYMFQLKRSSNGTQEPFTQCHNPGPSNITCGLYPSFDRCSSFQRIDKTEKACLGIFLATVVKTVGMSKKQNSDEFSLNKTTECKFLFRPILAFQKVPKEKVPTNSQRMTHYRNNMQEFCGSWVFRSTALEGFGSEAFSVLTGTGLEEDDLVKAFELFRRAAAGLETR